VSDGLLLPASIAATEAYTLFHVARFFASGAGSEPTRGRILDSADGAWASGFDAGRSGVAVRNGVASSVVSIRRDFSNPDSTVYSFQPPDWAVAADVLIAGGGGGGGDTGGTNRFGPCGGGGGAEVIERLDMAIPTGIAMIRVGRGGRAGSENGFDSAAWELIGIGGGSGRRMEGNDGGSGGGEGRDSGVGTSGGASLAKTGMGNAGGSSSSSGGSGGGGATQKGVNSTDGNGTNGGEGYQLGGFGVHDLVYGSGGGGGRRSGSSGSGGTNGGNGGRPGTAGVKHTGSGGGAADGTDQANQFGGDGGSGVVLIKLKSSDGSLSEIFAFHHGAHDATYAHASASEAAADRKFFADIQNDHDSHGDSWVVSADQSGTYRSQAQQRGTLSASTVPDRVTVNAGGGAKSDWAMAELLAYGRSLDMKEIWAVERYLRAKYFQDLPVESMGWLSGSAIQAIAYTGAQGGGPNNAGGPGYPISLGRLMAQLGRTFGQRVAASVARGRVVRGALDRVGLKQKPVGAFAFRRLFREYGGPQIRMQRSSDDVMIDVFFDHDGKILDMVGVDGTSYSDDDFELGVTPGIVNKWYDQSGNSRHANNTAGGTTIEIEDGEYVVRCGANTGQLSFDCPFGQDMTWSTRLKRVQTTGDWQMILTSWGPSNDYVNIIHFSWTTNSTDGLTLRMNNDTGGALFGPSGQNVVQELIAKQILDRMIVRHASSSDTTYISYGEYNTDITGATNNDGFYPVNITQRVMIGTREQDTFDTYDGDTIFKDIIVFSYALDDLVLQSVNDSL